MPQATSDVAAMYIDRMVNGRKTCAYIAISDALLLVASRSGFRGYAAHPTDWMHFCNL